MAEWPDRCLSAWNLPKSTWTALRLWETRFSALMKWRLNCLFSLPSVPCLEESRSCSIPSQMWSMAVVVSCCEGVFQWQGPGELVRVEGNLNAALYRDILYDVMFQSAQDFRLGWRFTFQQDNQPKHQCKSGLGTTLWTFSSGPARAWTSTQANISRDLKMAVHRQSPSNLTELEKICREEWQKIHKSPKNYLKHFSTSLQHTKMCPTVSRPGCIPAAHWAFWSSWSNLDPP